MLAGSRLTKFVAIGAMMAGAVALAVDVADARPGGSKSYGSRGSNTYTAPPTTNTAPKAATPMDRTMTQPGRPTAGTPGTPGAQAAQPAASRFGGWGGILMGGLIGAGLASMFGLGAMAGVLGFLLQALLIGGLIYLAWSFFARRRAATGMAAAGGPAPSGYGNPNVNQRQALNQGPTGQPTGSGPMGAGLRPGMKAPLTIGPDDYGAFERLLGEIQVAYGRADLDALSSRTTPEILSYFAQDLDANAKRGVRNEIGEPKLLQGDLAEAWTEASGDYATVAMRFAVTDALVEIQSGRVIEGDRETPVEVTEIWTFIRPRGGRPDQWELSAIQQTG